MQHVQETDFLDGSDGDQDALKGPRLALARRGGGWAVSSGTAQRHKCEYSQQWDCTATQVCI